MRFLRLFTGIGTGNAPRYVLAMSDDEILRRLLALNLARKAAAGA